MRRFAIYLVVAGCALMGIYAPARAQPATARAPATRQLAPEVAELIQHIADNEKKLQNLYVEGESWQEKQTDAGQWERTPQLTRVRFWSDGNPAGRARVDVLAQIVQAANEPTPRKMWPYSEAFDGQKFVTIRDKETFARVSDERRKSLDGSFADGVMFSNVLVSIGRDAKALSQSLPEMLARDIGRGATVTVMSEEFLNVKAIKLNSTNTKKVSWTWWFDPSRGYSMIGWSIVREAHEPPVVLSEIRVTQLAEAAPGVWYPKEAFYLTPQERDRSHYLAGKIVANDPKFDPSVLTLKIPESYEVQHISDPPPPTPVKDMTPQQRNLQSASNLRQIGQAVQLYAVEHKGHGPKALEDLEKVGVPAEALTCPVAGKHYVYFGYEKDGNPLAVVAYEESDDDQASVNILCANGRVGLFSANDAARIVGNGRTEKSDWGWVKERK